MADTKWRNYEEVATYLLDKFADHFGLSRVEGKQPLLGIRSGTEWTIDAKGIRQGSEAFVIVECRRHDFFEFIMAAAFRRRDADLVVLLIGSLTPALMEEYW